jgi:hypothetical protein
VDGLDEVVVFAYRNGLRVREGGLQFAGEFVDSHVFASPKFSDEYPFLVSGYSDCFVFNVGASGGTSSFCGKNRQKIDGYHYAVAPDCGQALSLRSAAIVLGFRQMVFEQVR